jgi:hypothetical protein
MNCVTCNEPIDEKECKFCDGFQCDECCQEQRSAGWHEIMNDNADKTKGTT